MRSFVLTEDAAREIVKAGTAKKYRMTQEFRRPSEPLSASSLQVFENGVLVSSAAQILNFSDGLTVEAADARTVRIESDASITIDGETIRNIIVRSPLVYELNDDALTIKAGMFWDNLDGSKIIANPDGELPNSCHVRGGSGIRVVDGGACSHGALDGFIAQIDWTGYEVDGESTRALRLGV
ncbi:MAG: hypothetical protein IKU86_13615, partial [Thermoguttaceae bacterium]|nr:hypothetical protein [Thermoguttaceae bacterium]